MTLIAFGVQSPLAAQEEIKPFGRRIISCEAAKIEAHPWQVAFNVRFPDGKTYLCGGSIIHEKWVLTAAHCFPSNDPTLGRVKSGRTNIASNDGWAALARVVRHQDYNAATKANDIALVKLRDKPTGKAIPRSNGEPSVGQMLEVTGWGVTETGNTSDTLCKTSVPYVPTSKCNEKESYNGEILPGMLCAGYPKGGKDSCGGDSGGPLTSQGEALLVGVVSFGQGCALENKYGVYTRVSSYQGWVDAIVGADPD